MEEVTSGLELRTAACSSQNGLKKHRVTHALTLFQRRETRLLCSFSILKSLSVSFWDDVQHALHQLKYKFSHN